jgi:HD-like signal output (HDOD) protein
MIPEYTREALEYELRRIPAAPRIIPKLAALVRDPNLNPEDVFEVIRHDPSLTARLIALCRSATVHRGSEVNTVSQAVQYLGFAQVYRIAVVVAFRSGFFVRFHAYQESADEVWRKALAVACFMEEFASETGDDMGESYTTGLLHMIGMFFLDWHCSQIPGAKIAKSTFETQLETERKLTGTTSLDISAMALDYWGFPKAICEPIRWSRAPQEGGVFGEQAARLQAAITLSQNLGVLTSRSVFGPRPKALSLLVGGKPVESFAPIVHQRLAAAIDFLRL